MLRAYIVGNWLQKNNNKKQNKKKKKTEPPPPTHTHTPTPPLQKKKKQQQKKKKKKKKYISPVSPTKYVPRFFFERLAPKFRICCPFPLRVICYIVPNIFPASSAGNWVQNTDYVGRYPCGELASKYKKILPACPVAY